MILVDTSVWIDHLRHSNLILANLLNTGQVYVHPFVTGELALGNLRKRDVILDTLHNMPNIKIAQDEEVLSFIQHNKIYGLGVGYIDAHLLTSVRLTPGSLLWTQDKRLTATARQLKLFAELAQ